jgi:hypothetical protein
MPSIEVYKGVRIHDFQTAERIAVVVKPEVDTVMTMDSPHDLFDWSASVEHSPESRALATAKLEVLWQLAAEHRAIRPADIDLEMVRAVSAGVDSLGWADPGFYCSMLDHPKDPDHTLAAPRDKLQRDRLEQERTSRRNAERARCGLDPTE